MATDTAQGAVGGFAAGAKLGSVIPGVGTVIGGVVGAVVGGVFGGASSRKKKKAARLSREINAIQRMTARRATIVEAIQAGSMAAISAQSDGFDPQGTSSAIGIQQSVYAQAQSNLKTESMVYNRQMKIASLLKQAQRSTDTLSLLKTVADKGPGLFGK